MSRIAFTLRELHSLWFGHLDVRLPKIFFSSVISNDEGKYDVILINFDHCRTFESDVNDYLKNYKAEMYYNSIQQGWPLPKYDFKQLGLIAYRIIYKDISDEEVVNKLKK